MKRSLAVVFGLFAISTAAPAMAGGPRPEQTVSIMHRAPRGTLVVHNKSGVTQHLTVGDKRLGLLRPGASKVIDLAAGRHVVTWTSTGRFATTEREVVRVSPHEREVLRLTSTTAALRVKNPYRYAVRLVVDGKRVGSIAPGATMSIAGLAPGRVELELFRGNQKLEDQTVRLTRGINTFEPGRFAFNDYR